MRGEKTRGPKSWGQVQGTLVELDGADKKTEQISRHQKLCLTLCVGFSQTQVGSVMENKYDGET